MSKDRPLLLASRSEIGTLLTGEGQKTIRGLRMEPLTCCSEIPPIDSYHMGKRPEQPQMARWWPIFSRF